MNCLLFSSKYRLDDKCASVNHKETKFFHEEHNVIRASVTKNAQGVKELKEFSVYQRAAKSAKSAGNHTPSATRSIIKKS